MGFRRVEDGFWVSPQIGLADIAEAKALGVRTIVNNRPDDEEPGQIAGADLKTEAEAAGLRFVEAPVQGGPSKQAVDAMAAALSEGPVLAFCKSGLRSMLIWGLAEVTTGRRERDDVLALARNAGFELSRWL